MRKFRATVCLRGPVLSLRAYIGKVPFREFNQADQDDFIKDLFKVRVVERMAQAVPSSVKLCDLTLS